MDTISNYFNAERGESMVFIAVGVVALAVSIWCVLLVRKPYFNGLALTLAVVAALQLIVGVTIYQRSPHDTTRVQQMVRSAPQRIHAEEVPRMRVVMRKFKVYLGVEVALLVLGLILLAYATPGGFLRGAAMGLTLQSVFTAVLDLVAMTRGDAYLSWLLSQP